MTSPRRETDPRIGLVGGLVILAVGLWILLGRPGLSGLGLTIVGGLLAAWSLWKLSTSGGRER